FLSSMLCQICEDLHKLLHPSLPELDEDDVAEGKDSEEEKESGKREEVEEEALKEKKNAEEREGSGHDEEDDEKALSEVGFRNKGSRTFSASSANSSSSSSLQLSSSSGSESNKT